MVCTVATKAGLKYHACVGVAMQLSMTLQRLICLQLCRLQQLFTNYSINLCAECWNKNDFIVAS